MVMALLIHDKSVDTNRTPDDPNVSLACVSARETLRMLEEDLFDKLLTKEELMRSNVYRLATDNALVTDVHGKGLVWGIDFPENEYGNESLAKRISLSCLEKGLLVDIAQTEKSIILMPPLIIHEKQINKAFQILSHSILENEKFSAGGK